MGIIMRNDIEYGGGGGANYIELTQAQYEALTPEEKTNGEIYLITDVDLQGQGKIVSGELPPTASLDASLYIQYSNNTITAIWSKVNNTWLVFQGGGGGSSITVTGSVTS